MDPRSTTQTAFQVRRLGRARAAGGFSRSPAVRRTSANAAFYTAEGVPTPPPADWNPRAQQLPSMVRLGQAPVPPNAPNKTDFGEGNSKKYKYALKENGEIDYDHPNPEYAAAFQALSSLRESPQRATLNTMVQAVQHLPVGMKLRLDLRGLSIGEIVVAITRKYGAPFLRGLYITARVRDIHVDLMSENGGVSPSYRDTQARHVPLWKVVPLNTTLPVFGGTRTLTQNIREMSRLLMEGSNTGNTSGSDMASFYLLSDVSLVRRTQAPSFDYISDVISPIRTGGFGELLTENTVYQFTAWELLDSYYQSYFKYANYKVTDGVRDKNYTRMKEKLMRFVFPPEKPLYADQLNEILKKKTFTLVIPGGSRCCVDVCIEMLVQLAREEYGDQLPLAILRLDMLQVRENLKKAYVEKKIRNESSRKRSREGTLSTQASKDPGLFGRQWKKRTELGYSSFFFKLLKEELDKHQVNIRLFYSRFVQRTSFLSHVQSEVSEAMKTTSFNDQTPDGFRRPPYGTNAPLNLSMFRINLNGEVHLHYPPNTPEAAKHPDIRDNDEDDKVGLLHAIGIFPYIPKHLLNSQYFSRALYDVIESKTKPYMKTKRLQSIGNCKVNEETISNLVNHQLERHRKAVTETLIYENLPENIRDIRPRRYQDPDRDTSNARREKSERLSFVQRPLVLSYDIETVELTQECVDSGVVPQKFLKVNPDPSKYSQIERQIPYMVQWVPVNLSDEGVILMKKDAAGDLPYRNETIEPSFSARDDWIIGGEEKDGNAKKYRKGWIVLDEAKIEIGQGQLGQCIEDFIENAFQWAMKHKYTSIVAFAHNGAQFDAIVGQSYNTKYKIHKILKVGGGLLNLTLKIPLGGDGKRHFTFSFRDTRKYLGGSLATLCSDFKLPKVWAKLDCPIAQVQWNTCFRQDVLDKIIPYGLNDAYALAFIVKQINRILCLHPFDIVVPGLEEYVCPQKTNVTLQTMKIPTDLFSKHLFDLNIHSLMYVKPPVIMFITIMSFVKKVLSCHVSQSHQRKTHTPQAIDIPALRHYVDMSLIAGRVTAYAKVYSSSRFGDILEAYMGDRLHDSKKFMQEAIEAQDVKRCFDETSLYPAAMTLNALPLGKLCKLTRTGAQHAVNVMECAACEERMSICVKHDVSYFGNVRPFAIVLVRNFTPSPEAKDSLLNIIGRKIRPIELKSTKGDAVGKMHLKKSDGLKYTLETDEEATFRLWGEVPEDLKEREQLDPGFIHNFNVHGTVQAYTNIDLYWARKVGFTFDVIGGMMWEMSPLLSSLYKGLFKLRAKAKQEGNNSLQLGLKTLLNGGYGVHCQKQFIKKEHVVDLPQDIYDCDVSDSRVKKHIRDYYHDVFDSRFVLRENTPLTTKQALVSASMPNDLGEFLGGSSPNHIGAAVVAYARHMMNLVMFPIMKERDGAVTYTDTDSSTIFEDTYRTLQEKMPHLIDEKGSTLGTLKNDHSTSSNPNACILFSALGGKKVKMHIVGNPDTGELTIHNTFKGFMSQSADADGRKWNIDNSRYVISKGLIDILYDGKPEPYEGDRWSRTIENGVRIEQNVLFTPKSETYLKHCAGYVHLTPPNPLYKKNPEEGAALLVGCIPHGSTKYMDNRMSSENKVWKVLLNPEDGSSTLGSSWPTFLDEHLDGRKDSTRVTRRTLMDFLDKYYSKRHLHHGEFERVRLNPKDHTSDQIKTHEESEDTRQKKHEKEFAEYNEIQHVLEKAKSLDKQPYVSSDEDMDTARCSENENSLSDSEEYTSTLDSSCIFPTSRSYADNFSLFQELELTPCAEEICLSDLDEDEEELFSLPPPNSQRP